MSLRLFNPAPTTLLALITYLTVTILLLVIQFIPPRNIPSQTNQERMNIDVTAAWRDLEHITGDWGYHPYNSRSNDRVRKYLLDRISQILETSGVFKARGGVEVEIVDDMYTNITFAGSNVMSNTPGTSVYFEGTNVVAVIKGSEKRSDLGAVLVNAHYDSVSTGLGVTDDGTAVVSLLQLLSYFTNPNLPQHLKPKRDLLLLWNNGEEDFLNGAKAFTNSPLAHMPKIFYNLEGAGAGGRATLFRSTDTEVTSFYKKNVKRPFGMSVSADGFKNGLIRSQTDYKVFTEDLGMRGLDVAFWKPRSRYHTLEDDVRHSSKEALWHMLGGAIETVQAMVLDTKAEYEVPFEKGGTDSVWFDIFGRGFALLRLNSLFAITIALLTITPFILGVTIYLLVRNDRLYMFSNAPLRGKSTHGWKGFFSYPVAFLFATAAVIGTAFLFVKVNPMVVYGNLYLIWTCFLSEWIIVAWFISKAGQWWRASALTRGYTFMWQSLGWYAGLVFSAVLEDQRRITSGYFVPIYYAGTFLCFWISLLEQFALPSKINSAPPVRPFSPVTHRSIDSAGRLYSSSIEPHLEDNVQETEPDETTGLLTRRNSGRGRIAWPTFRRTLNGESHDGDSDNESSDGDEATERKGIYGHEQRWSKHLPGWTWILQWLLAVPMQIILTGQIGIFLGEALNMTGADGSDLLTVYLGIALFGILYLIPLAPFIHRITHHVALFLAFTFLVTILYNLVAFPFHSDARLKVYFQQQVDLDTGKNVVHLVGVEKYIKDIIQNSLPSAYGKEIECGEDKLRKGLSRCSWEGLSPNVLRGGEQQSEDLNADKSKWLEFKVNSMGHTSARFEVKGLNTRACKIMFNDPITGLEVKGIRYGKEPDAGDGNGNGGNGNGNVTKLEHSPLLNRSPVPPGGTNEVRLWSRDWDRGWRVDVSWNPKSENQGQEGLDGHIICLWSDANTHGVIPAYDELLAFIPVWAIPSKLSDGLVEGLKSFRV